MRTRAKQRIEKYIVFFIRLISGLFVLITNTIFLTLGSSNVDTTFFWDINLIVQFVVFLIDFYVIIILGRAIYHLLIFKRIKHRTYHRDQIVGKN